MPETVVVGRTRFECERNLNDSIKNIKIKDANLFDAYVHLCTKKNQNVFDSKNLSSINHDGIEKVWTGCHASPHPLATKCHKFPDPLSRRHICKCPLFQVMKCYTSAIRELTDVQQKQRTLTNFNKILFPKSESPFFAFHFTFLIIFVILTSNSADSLPVDETAPDSRDGHKLTVSDESELQINEIFLLENWLERGKRRTMEDKKRREEDKRRREEDEKRKEENKQLWSIFGHQY
ncbi:hypothetical protein HELRODRAFT_178501 [Helobdella robusta]|uniref:Uncharacterized protein n=1 Tax=Helobdella robusta TaxID=6412 RepID=T1FD98_HELRO|nr:hypothetical protein HELRODRAFT_178501 [Helobdella robusta]ESN97054.1 hypothetical protein HELRODRAFT_178501 [Helobdella robusta]